MLDFVLCMFRCMISYLFEGFCVVVYLLVLYLICSVVVC